MKLVAAFAIALAVLLPLNHADARPEARDTNKYKVVINHEEQYSIWVVDQDPPRGWKPTGFVGTREQALDYIEEVWTDMRPLSQRRELALKLYRELRQQQGLRKD